MNVTLHTIKYNKFLPDVILKKIISLILSVIVFIQERIIAEIFKKGVNLQKIKLYMYKVIRTGDQDNFYFSKNFRMYFFLKIRKRCLKRSRGPSTDIKDRFFVEKKMY